MTTTWTPQPGKALVLRTCDDEMQGYGGFQWPSSGPVEAPDWEPTARCGHGLHGLLWGAGDAGYLSWHPSAKWLVVEVDAADVVDINGKVKYPRGVVVYVGDRSTAASLVARHAPAGVVVHGATATAGDRGTATAGDRGTATAGDEGTATAGDHGLIAVTYYDSDAGQYRRLFGIVGQDDIRAGVAYRIEGGRFIPAERDAEVTA